MFSTWFASVPISATERAYFSSLKIPRQRWNESWLKVKETLGLVLTSSLICRVTSVVPFI